MSRVATAQGRSEGAEARARLTARTRAELRQPILSAAVQLADHVRELYGGSLGPILFYGSCLRADSPEGVMDLYLLTRGHRQFNGSAMLAGLNALIPPNIFYWETERGGERLRGKGAALTLDQFRASCRFDAWSPSVWARFCQPARLVDAPKDADVEATVDGVVEAVMTAARWAALLGPETGTARDYWTALFAATYSVELRPERPDRPAQIVDADPERYAALLPLAWEAAGLAFDRRGEVFHPRLSAAERQQAARRWAARRAWGKVLSGLRISKGVLTFDGGVDYLLWKIERHSGVRIDATDWQKQHPFLAAPSVFAKLWRAGAIR